MISIKIQQLFVDSFKLFSILAQPWFFSSNRSIRISACLGVRTRIPEMFKMTKMASVRYFFNSHRICCLQEEFEKSNSSKREIEIKDGFKRFPTSLSDSSIKMCETSLQGIPLKGNALLSSPNYKNKSKDGFKSFPTSNVFLIRLTKCVEPHSKAFA